MPGMKDNINPPQKKKLSCLCSSEKIAHNTNVWCHCCTEHRIKTRFAANPNFSCNMLQVAQKGWFSPLTGIWNVGQWNNTYLYTVYHNYTPFLKKAYTKYLDINHAGKKMDISRSLYTWAHRCQYDFHICPYQSNCCFRKLANTVWNFAILFWTKY